MWTGADYEIDDPRPIAASAPYTFFLPSPTDVSALGVGDLIKTTVRTIPQSSQWDAERLWFEIVAISHEALDGRLKSEPSDMPGFSVGRTIRIPRAAVIDLIFTDDRTRTNGPKEYWDRCLVDSAALNGSQPVAYIYREDPDTRLDDRFPDSGWRIRARQKQTGTGNEDVQYVALGAVLNKDDSWLHLLDAPVGSAFRRDFDRSLWVEEET